MKKILLIAVALLAVLTFSCIDGNQNPNIPAPPRIIIQTH